MRVILVLLLLFAATAEAQSATGEQAPPAPPSSANPEGEFGMPAFPSAPAPEAPPAKSSVAPAQRPPPTPAPSEPAKPATPKSDMSAFEIITFPLGAGLLVGTIASRFPIERSTLIYIVLGTVGVTTLAVITAVGLMAIRKAPEEPAGDNLKAMLVPVVLSAGRGNTGIAAGPGLFLRF